MYFSGDSSGAVHAGNHADQLVPRFARVSMASGGYRTSTCASGEVPVYLVTGDQDFLLNLGELARDWFTVVE